MIYLREHDLRDEGDDHDGDLVLLARADVREGVRAQAERRDGHQVEPVGVLQ